MVLVQIATAVNFLMILTKLQDFTARSGNKFKYGVVLADYVSCIFFGLLVAALASASVYADSDKFFTQTERAQVKNMIIMAVETLLFVAVLIWGFCISDKLPKTSKNAIPY